MDSGNSRGRFRETAKVGEAIRDPPTVADLKHQSVVDNLAVGLVYVLLPIVLVAALLIDLYRTLRNV